MGIILDTIKKHYGTENYFSSWDLHLITKINQKVIQIALKKMHNNEILWRSSKYDIFQLNTDEEVKKRRIKTNENIDKYCLKNKKYKIQQMTKNPRNAGRKSVPNGVLVKTTVPKNKVKKLKDYSKELIKEYNDETRSTTTIS